MAWKGKVVAKSEDYTAGTLIVNVEFFDDAAPATILGTHQFVFPAWMSLTEMQLAVRSCGADERRKRTQIDAVFAAIPLGVEITI